jgi:hypothetical protein
MKIDLKHAILEVLDGGGTPNTLQIKLGEGTFTWDQKRSIEYVKDRGLLDTTREGDEEPVDIRLDALYEFLKSSSGSVTPYEAITGTMGASTWTSTGGACEPYAVDLRLTYTPPCGGETDEVVLISDFRYESITADAKAGTLAFTGKANIVAPTITRGV